MGNLMTGCAKPKRAFSRKSNSKKKPVFREENEQTIVNEKVLDAITTSETSTVLCEENERAIVSDKKALDDVVNSTLETSTVYEPQPNLDNGAFFCPLADNGPLSPPFVCNNDPTKIDEGMVQESSPSHSEGSAQTVPASSPSSGFDSDKENMEVSLEIDCDEGNGDEIRPLPTPLRKFALITPGKEAKIFNGNFKPKNTESVYKYIKNKRVFEQ